MGGAINEIGLILSVGNDVIITSLNHKRSILQPIRFQNFILFMMFVYKFHVLSVIKDSRGQWILKMRLQKAVALNGSSAQRIFTEKRCLRTSVLSGLWYASKIANVVYRRRLRRILWGDSNFKVIIRGENISCYLEPEVEENWNPQYYLLPAMRSLKTQNCIRRIIPIYLLDSVSLPNVIFQF